jgi:hypothetical protein
MVMLDGTFTESHLLYDVSDPIHPRLICSITNTSAHLVLGWPEPPMGPGDGIAWLKPISANETDIVLHSLTRRNDSLVGTFPVRPQSGAWLPDTSVAAYTVPVPPDNGNFPAGGTQVWLYSQGLTAPLYTYRNGIGDCICRFGLPPQVLAVSPDGQYIVAGWEAGKGSQPLAVYRVADRSLVATMDSQVSSTVWDRGGHRLLLTRFGTLAEQAWTPEAGVVGLAGAATWSYLPGVSPDGRLVAYTAYSDPTTFQQPRVYLYDKKAGSTRMLVDQMRTQGIFVKDGWVWYLDERPCAPADSCAGATMPTGKVFAMQLSTGAEIPVSFAAGEDPITQSGDVNRLAFGPGEFWPAT